MSSNEKYIRVKQLTHGKCNKSWNQNHNMYEIRQICRVFIKNQYCNGPMIKAQSKQFLSM